MGLEGPPTGNEDRPSRREALKRIAMSSLLPKLPASLLQSGSEPNLDALNQAMRRPLDDLDQQLIQFTRDADESVLLGFYDAWAEDPTSPYFREIAEAAELFARGETMNHATWKQKIRERAQTAEVADVTEEDIKVAMGDALLDIYNLMHQPFGLYDEDLAEQDAGIAA